MSKFNQQFFDDGFKARLNSELIAFKNKHPLQVPVGSYHATAQANWLKGFNSPTAHDIDKHINTQNHSRSQRLPKNHIEHLRSCLKHKGN